MTRPRNADIDIALRAWDGVYTIKQQAHFLTATQHDVWEWRRQLGLTTPRPPVVEITPVLDAQIRAMFAEGMGRNHVSQATKVGKHRLARLYPDGKMDPQTKGSLGGAVRNFNRKARK